MVPTDTVGVSVIEESSGVSRAGANQGALLAPLDGSATISANVVKRYRRQSDAEADHGDGSDIAEGVGAALDAGLPRVFTVGVAANSASPKTDTFDTTSGDNDADPATGIDTADLPLTTVTSATASDGTNSQNLTIEYTAQDPNSLTPDTDTIIINTATGDFELDASGLSGSFSSVDITYEFHNWDEALDKLDLNAYEYHTYANNPYNAENFGVFDKLLSHASAENKLVAGALPTGTTTTDAQTLADNTTNGDRCFLVAAHYSGDLTSAVMGDLARRKVNATTKEQQAPRGINYDDSYVQTDFGGEQSPASGTFHHMGVNAIYEDAGGTFRYTNDRAVTGLTDFYRFHSTRRSVRFAENRIEEDLLALRRGSGTSIPFTTAGLNAVRAAIQGSLSFLNRQGVIAEGVVNTPTMDEISDSDRQNRVLDYVSVSIRLTGQIHFVSLDLEVDV